MARTEVALAPAPAVASHKHSLTQKHIWEGIVVIISLVVLVGCLFFCFKRKLFCNKLCSKHKKGQLNSHACETISKENYFF